MDGTKMVIVPEMELESMIISAVGKAIKPFISKKVETKKNLTFEEGLAFLNENGYRIGKSQLYKNTMDNIVPCSRFGRKIVFDSDELMAWAESKSKSGYDAITQTVAKNARRKGQTA